MNTIEEQLKSLEDNIKLFEVKMNNSSLDSSFIKKLQITLDHLDSRISSQKYQPTSQEVAYMHELQALINSPAIPRAAARGMEYLPASARVRFTP